MAIVRFAQKDGILTFTIEEGLKELESLKGAPNPPRSEFSIQEKDASAGALSPKTAEAAVRQLAGSNYRQLQWTVVDENGLGIWEHKPA
jgi:hypothetical protein